MTKPDSSCPLCVNAAREFYKDMMKQNLLDLGMAGWMADFGEYTPTNAVSAAEASWWGQADRGEILHQKISEDWASLNRELLEENGMLGEVLFWMRAGGIRSKEYQVRFILLILIKLWTVCLYRVLTNVLQ